MCLPKVILFKSQINLHNVFRPRLCRLNWRLRCCGRVVLKGELKSAAAKVFYSLVDRVWSTFLGSYGSTENMHIRDCLIFLHTTFLHG